jgi:hypothetical protein
MEVLSGMLVFGGVATAYVPANETKPQVHPTVPHLQTLFAALGLGLDRTDLIEMSAFIGHYGLLGGYFVTLTGILT